MSQPVKTQCAILQELKEEVKNLQTGVTQTVFDTLVARINLLDTSATVGNLVCRSPTDTEMASSQMKSLLPGDADFTLCQPRGAWSAAKWDELGLIWGEPSSGGKFCTPLHARPHESGLLFDTTNTVVCTGEGQGSMSKSIAIAHDLRSIRDRVCP
jgi:hypothetical protein